MVTKWEAPKRSQAGRPPSADYETLAEDLRKNRGKWALVGENMSVSIGSHISSGRIHAFRPAGAFEGAIRGKNGSRAQKVFARYVGE